MERLQGQQCNYIIECFSFKFCKTQIKVITTANRERKIFIRSRSELKEKTSELRLVRGNPGDQVAIGFSAGERKWREFYWPIGAKLRKTTAIPIYSRYSMENCS